MTELNEIRGTLRADGVAIARSVLDEARLRTLLAAVRADTAPGSVRHHLGQTYGVRGLLASRPDLAATLGQIGLTQLTAEALGRPAIPIDAIFFDKYPDANWAVPAHQDVVVPVPRNADLAQVKRQRLRGAQMYGEPPVAVLQQLLAVRVHFDSSDESTGALYVVAGTHLRGRIPEAELSSLPGSAFKPCYAAEGDLLFIKPLLVHRSGRSTSQAHRRVLHVVYAPEDGWHAPL